MYIILYTYFKKIKRILREKKLFGGEGKGECIQRIKLQGKCRAP
jgi:hypothetical protein